MIELPDPSKSWDYENGFYLTCGTQRLSKFMAHCELFKRTIDLPGEIVECGVFKGVSLMRWAHLRSMLCHDSAKRIIGFDTFGKFPGTGFAADQNKREDFIANAGDESISTQQLSGLLDRQGLGKKVELVPGDISQTVPRFLEANPQLKISLLNLDTDIYEPAVTILEHLYGRIVKGGVLILDDYAVFPGETRAVDEFFADKDVEIRRFGYAMTPSYVIIT